MREILYSTVLPRSCYDYVHNFYILVYSEQMTNIQVITDMLDCVCEEHQISSINMINN